ERADAAGARLADAEQADHVGAIGVEAQAAIGQRTRIGRQERSALLVLGLAIGAADMRALVTDRAHQFAAAVLEDRRAEGRAEAKVDAAQVVLVVLVDGKATQLRDAAAVLQLLGNI